MAQKTISSFFGDFGKPQIITLLLSFGEVLPLSFENRRIFPIAFDAFAWVVKCNLGSEKITINRARIALVGCYYAGRRWSPLRTPSFVTMVLPKKTKTPRRLHFQLFKIGKGRLSKMRFNDIYHGSFRPRQLAPQGLFSGYLIRF